MDVVGGALLMMVGGFAAGAGLAALAPSDRAARAATGAGAALGCAGGLAAALMVLASRRPFDAAWPNLVAVAGGVMVRLDPLGAPAEQLAWACPRSQRSASVARRDYF